MLQIHNLKCGYKEKFHISDITLHARKGDFTGIIGPNGSGKTTLFRGITGELPAKTGNILLNGRHIHEMTYKEKAKNMAIVTQELDEPAITVEEYVLMGRMPYHRPFQFFESKADYRITHEYLQLTQIFHLKDKYMYQISGGERQLAAVARALNQEPKLLLLDDTAAPSVSSAYICLQADQKSDQLNADNTTSALLRGSALCVAAARELN